MTRNRITVTKLPRSQVEIEGEIPAEQFELYWKQSLALRVKEAELPGFRKGHAPEKLVLEAVGEARVLDDAAHAALDKFYEPAIREHNLDVVGNPEAKLISLQRGNLFRFKITVSVIPQIKLPPYRALAEEIYKTKNEIVVEEKEVEEALQSLRSMRLPATHDTARAGIQSESGDTKKGGFSLLDDTFAHSVGDFKNLAALTNAIHENIRLQKEKRERDRRRGELMDRMAPMIHEAMPDVLVESELARLMSQLTHDVERMGATLPEYLAQIKKSEKDLRTEWRGDAEKQVKIQLILNKIAEKENIRATREEIFPEMSHILSRMKNTDQHRVEQYVSLMVQNEKVLTMLEGASDGRTKNSSSESGVQRSTNNFSANKEKSA